MADPLPPLTLGELERIHFWLHRQWLMGQRHLGPRNLRNLEECAALIWRHMRAANISQHNARILETIYMAKPSNYIKVGETKRSKDEQRRQKEIKATLYINNAWVCDVEVITSQEDKDPHGSAIAILMLKFNQMLEVRNVDI